MAVTTTKKKISDFFNPITNPGGGVPVDRSKLTVSGAPSLSNLFAPTVSPAMKQWGSQFQIDGSGQMVKKPAPVAPGPVAPAPVAGGPVSRGTAPAPVAPGPVAPAPTTPAAPTSVDVPAQYKNADGSMKTPEQVAAEVAATLKKTSEAPDIGRLSGNEFGNAEKTEEQLQAETALMNNARNDIATGETDPFGIGSDSGIAYTPAELKAIENAYAGIYDPAITTAHAKLATKQKENEEKRTAETQAKRDEALFKNDLELLAKKHDYDLEAMKQDQSFQMTLAAYKSSLDAKNNPAASFSPYVEYKQGETVAKAMDLLGRAIEDPDMFGKAGAFFGNVPAFFRPQKYNDYVTQLDSLKNGIFSSEIQSMRADSATGGAVGQVAVAEMTKMENALASLETMQSADLVQNNLRNIVGSINRYRVAKGENPIVPAAPAGDSGDVYGLPGYVSDGNQWVLNE